MTLSPDLKIEIPVLEPDDVLLAQLTMLSAASRPPRRARSRALIAAGGLFAVGTTWVTGALPGMASPFDRPSGQHERAPDPAPPLPTPDTPVAPPANANLGRSETAPGQDKGTRDDGATDHGNSVLDHGDEPDESSDSSDQTTNSGISNGNGNDTDTGTGNGNGNGNGNANGTGNGTQGNGNANGHDNGNDGGHGAQGNGNANGQQEDDGSENGNDGGHGAQGNGNANGQENGNGQGNGNGNADSQ